jgi:hypothetical protein
MLDRQFGVALRMAAKGCSATLLNVFEAGTTPNPSGCSSACITLGNTNGLGGIDDQDSGHFQRERIT